MSETKQSYQIGLLSGQLLSVKKRYGDPAYVVGDIVGLIEKKGRQVIDRLLVRERVVAKSANQTLKDYRQIDAQQLLASNVDQLFILIALDQNFSLSKVERFVLFFDQSEIDLHILLTKKDVCPDVDQQLAHLSSLYPQVQFTAISLLDDSSIKAVKSQLLPGKIGLMIGASGAGKSSLLNRLLGLEMVKTNAVKKKDGKGKHTTTASYLHVCKEIGYYMIDSPGFKGIDHQDEVKATSLFADIVDLAKSCKFSDCQHDTDPACAVKAAVMSGQLSPEKLERYHYQARKIERFKMR